MRCGSCLLFVFDLLLLGFLCYLCVCMFGVCVLFGVCCVCAVCVRCWLFFGFVMVLFVLSYLFVYYWGVLF